MCPVEETALLVGVFSGWLDFGGPTSGICIDKTNACKPFFKRNATSISFQSPYFEKLSDDIRATAVTGPGLIPMTMHSGYYRLVKLLMEARERGHAVFLAGSGASRSIAAHMFDDLTNTLGIRAINLCDQTDSAEEHHLEHCLERMGGTGDVFIAICSQGETERLLTTTRLAGDLGMDVVTFTGVSSENRLRGIGNLSFFVCSRANMLVEAAHVCLTRHAIDAALTWQHEILE
ncbi:MAG: SIS domain-containing protein [Desulfovibrio sp.]|nr:SIS domain-containing protein [Desulfovibrio sp.]MBI4959123.1 SIS domain-containing protein [Desulfovibrio sp.]